MSETSTSASAGRANLDAFAATLTELARSDRNVLAVCSDSRGSGKLVPFAKELPGQLVEVGIAEQNLVGVAAGLASCGKRVFAVSPACFLSARALEQIKNDVAYSDQPVVLVGISAGVSYGALGATHHSTHDFAALRAIHNLTVVAPADNHETCCAVRAAARAEHPVYLRVGKRPLPDLHTPETPFEFGKAITIRGGKDVAFIACGETVRHAVEAAGVLAAEGVSVRVLSMHTIKPLDGQAVLAAGRECRAVITVEEHSVHGGLGEACAAVLMGGGAKAAFAIVGFPDEYMVTGNQLEIFTHYGISAQGLARRARELLSGSRT
ncbi:MAG: transketolase family protein [Phycisphaerae bacterium]|nr:transketolase family protein [Phycisphaerae bacterium]